MKPLNLYTLTRFVVLDRFALFEKQLSERSSPLKVKEHEISCLRSFVDSLSPFDASLNIFDGFFYSFEIPQIGKEFDLLRISRDLIVNIELKSQNVPEHRIKQQLLKNKYYLSHLSRDVSLFTYIKSAQTLLRLTMDGELVKANLYELFCVLANQKPLFKDDIESLFKVSDYLVSPLNTPEKFLAKDYFLTTQQDEFKKQILDVVDTATDFQFIALTGGPGTGKTLLLYDLAVHCSTMGKCCLIHCGILSDGHEILRQKLDNVDIIVAKQVNFLLDFSKYKFVFLDESHRIYINQFQEVVERTKEYGAITVFSYDSRQILSKKEDYAAISNHIEALPNLTKLKLSSKIRTNRELASFIRRLMNLKSTDVHPHYPSVTISYANGSIEALALLSHFKSKGFTFIHYTKSNYYAASLDVYCGDYNTHRVIGQEFDNVVMIMDDTFQYDAQGKLQAKAHPNPNYLYRQLLFQGLTRVREKLALIVVDDEALFEKILSILQENA